MRFQPIRTEDDHKAALARIDELWDAKPGTAGFDEGEALVVLVEAYESKAHPIGPPRPIDAILFRMEQMGAARKDLEPLIGTRARVSEVLAGQRPLSITMIRALHAKWNIPAEVLIAEVKGAKAAKRSARKTVGGQGRLARGNGTGRTGG